MLGLEVLGGIGAVIAIIDASIKVWVRTGKDIRFGATFETVGDRLPVLRDILQTCLENFEPIQTLLPADAAQGLLKTIENCRRRAKTLDAIFQKTIPSKDDQWWERSRMVAQRLRRGRKVEELMKAITEDVQNLVNYHAVKSANPKLHLKLREIVENTPPVAPLPSPLLALLPSPLLAPLPSPLLAPLPLSTVPFRQNIDFVDREMPNNGGSLLEHIKQQYKAGASRVALVGIGGAGKSQLAIEYCHRLREQSPQTWVFWIHASNVDRIEQGYREIAERVKIPGHKDPKKNIFELVAGWLQDESKGTWMLVLDNLDDDTILSIPRTGVLEAQSGNRNDLLRRPLSAYLPQSQNGVILITTRTTSVTIKLAESRDVITVNQMTDMDAITLLKNKLNITTNDGDLQILASILECMPLAIEQATGYIKQKEAKYSVRQYIEAFQRNEKNTISLLNYEAGCLQRDLEAKNSIIITWQISFNDIREKWPLSADLLSLMCYFDRQGIPREVLRVQPQQEEVQNLMTQEEKDAKGRKKDEDKDIGDDNPSETSSDDMFEEAVERLSGYSFVSLGKDDRSFEMHGLVQLATRTWLTMHGQDEKWKALFSKNLHAALPNSMYENWDQWEMLFPHAKSAERHRPKENIPGRDWAMILRKAAWYARAKGDYHEAERMCEKSIRALRNILGEEDVETSHSTEVLATMRLSQGRWKEAEELFVQVIKTRKRVLRPEHPHTLSSIHNLALSYERQGRWKEAEELNMQVIESRKRVLEPEHPDMLSSVHNLALTYSKQGRWKEAEELNMQVMETAKRVLGPEHPHTLSSMHSLAITMKNEGRNWEAVELMVDCVQLRSRVLPANHPDTLSSTAALANWQTSE